MRIYILPKISLVCGLAFPGAAALADDPRQALREAQQMMANLQSYCAAASEAEGSQPADAYFVYAYSAFHVEVDPLQGQRETLAPVVRPAVFESPEALQKAKARYEELRQHCQQRIGLQRYREFPFQHKSWTYTKRAEAQAHAARLRRESYMKYWPEVLELAVDGQTESDRYFLFAYSDLEIRARWEDDEEENELTWRATVRRQETRIFDDAQVAAAAEKLYKKYMAAWKNVGDGRGRTVGEIKPQVQQFASFDEAHQARQKLGDGVAPLP